ncbi:hypothetical protein V8B55DRAFT_1440720 [Mucor lusitanicus]
MDAKPTAASLVMVATTAFATGIDKGDIKFVWHFGVPESMVEYAQSSGRAKRDGKAFGGPADCCIFICDSELKKKVDYLMSVDHASLLGQ